MFAPLVSFGQQAQGQVQATQVNVKVRNVPFSEVVSLLTEM